MRKTRALFTAGVALYALWAPQGELDTNEELFARSSPRRGRTRSGRRRCSSTSRRMTGIAAHGAMERSRIRAEANEHVAGLQQETWESNQRSQDRLTEAFSQTIREVEAYVDTVRGGQVELPSGYDDVWTNGNGAYLLSETPGWNPNTVLTDSSWTQIHQRP